MKKIIFSLFGLLLVFTSCENAIEITQPGLLDVSRTFETVADLDNGLLGVYDQFDYTPAIQFSANFTDEISIGFDSGGQGLALYGFQLNAASAISNAQWTNYYRALNFATRLIEAAPDVTIGDGEQAEYNRILGETLALRAWAHFELLTYFSPDLTNDGSLGVIVLDFVPSIDQRLERNTTGEVFTSIEADLTQAASLITEQSNSTFISLDFITALRARMAAYRGNYTQADQFAADLLSRYPIADRTQYADMFADSDDTEVIFKLLREPGDGYDGQGSTGSSFAGGWAGANFAFVSADLDGSPYFEMSNGLFNLLDPGDIRFDVLIEPTSELSGSDSDDGNKIAIGKYQGSQGQPLMNDLKVFRSSEMLLIRAEAAIANNDLPGAAAFIEQLRDARFDSDQPTPTYADANAAYQDLLTERRVELAYEGFRWVDLKRLGERSGLAAVERNPLDCAVNNVCSLPLNDVKFDAIPIPIVEIDGNSNITQTPGY